VAQLVPMQNGSMI